MGRIDMTKQFLVLITMVFIGAASLLVIGLIQWNQSRVAVRLSVADPAALFVEKPDTIHFVPVRLDNDGYSNIEIVGINGC